MAEEMRMMIQMVDPEEQKRQEEKLKKENKEYLFCYVYEEGDNICKEWQILIGRTEIINFIKGILSDSNINVNIEDSFVLVNAEGVSLNDRITLKQFIDHVNGSLEEEGEELIAYE